MVSVYTCNFGKTKDTLKDPTVVNKNCKYVCFTDKKLKSKVWKIKRFKRVSNPIIATRLYKLRPYRYFPDETTLWVDCSYRLDTDPEKIIEKHLGYNDMVAYKHPHRINIRQEAMVLVELLHIDPRILKRQIMDYLQQGFFQEVITAPMFCIRRDHVKMREFGELWWNEYLRYPHGRDQMSIDYCIWKTGIKVGYFEGHYNQNPYAKFFKDK